jgi:protein-L-isoaspartate(D-aspartate) O-methyltransferase
MIDFERLRQSMVDSQIRPRDVTDSRLLTAMLELPRERFVPPERRALAYLDEDLVVRTAAPGRPPRYLMEPIVLARLIQALALDAGDRVLDVGCATGYSAALLACIAGEVVALEEDAELAAHARASLAELRLSNVQVVDGPLPEGHAPRAPYPAILLGGAVGLVPERLLSQLAEGGRLAAVVRDGAMGRAILYRRIAGAISSRPLFDAAVPMLPGFEAPQGFVF